MAEFVTYPRWPVGEDAAPAGSRAQAQRAPSTRGPVFWLWAVLLGWQLAYAVLRFASADVVPRNYGSKEVERVLFGGTLPTAWLQKAFDDGLPLSSWDWHAAAFALVYLGERYAVDALAGIIVGFLVCHVAQAVWGYFDWRAGLRS